MRSAIRSERWRKRSVDELADFGERVWTTREGKRLKWALMTPSHLRACAALMRRRYNAEIDEGWSLLCMLQGEHARELAESQLNSLLDWVSDLEIFCTEMEDYADYLAHSHLELSRRLNGS